MNTILLSITPTQQAALVWVCIFVFAATAVITLGSLVKWWPIDSGFQKALFTSLILEVVGLCIFWLKGSPQPSYIKITSPTGTFSPVVCPSNSVNIQAMYRIDTSEHIRGYLVTKNGDKEVPANMPVNAVIFNVDEADLLSMPRSVFKVEINRGGKRVSIDSLILLSNNLLQPPAGAH